MAIAKGIISFTTSTARLINFYFMLLLHGHSFTGFPTLFEVRSILDTGVWYGDVFAIGNVDYETATTFSFTVSVCKV